MTRFFRKLFLVLLAVTAMSGTAAHGAANPPVDEGWPREFVAKGQTALVYEPQVDSWDGFNLKAHTAVAVRLTNSQEPVYGVISFTAKTLVDKSERLVSLEELQIIDAKFPSVPGQAGEFLPLLQQAAGKRVRYVALDSLEAALVVADFKPGETRGVKNDVPQIIFANKPAVLIYIDGPPRYVPVKDARESLWRVLNTRVLLLKDAGGKHYLRLFDGYLEAPSLDGPWTVSARPPAEVKKATKAARESGQVDFMAGQPDPRTKELPSLKNGAPQVYMATRPAELIVTDGEPNFVPLAATDLLYVTNTTGNVFKYLRDNKTYLLLAGRWFRAASPAGPWEYVPHKSLPTDFARIPDDSPKENVKAAVPDTTQAREALVANSIPQTTRVSRNDAGFVDLVFDGEPLLAPITGTPLSYVSNCSTPVIRVNDQSWYAVENGVWFTATSLDGPWSVADHLPEVIYSIPASSPLHYVTYVKVYGSSPEYVYVGYTPGYLGTVIEDDVVVYGTGYYYSPWIGNYWYGPPLTYGLGVGLGWTPWWGWGWGFGFGWGWGSLGIGWFYPPTPWWGPFWGWGGHGWRGHPAWGPGGWACTSADFYHRRGELGRGRFSDVRYPHTGTRWSGRYGVAYNSRTGNLVAGQRGAVRNVATVRYAADARGGVSKTRPGQPLAAGGGRPSPGRSEVFATHEGNVYRSSSRGNWESVNAVRKNLQPGEQPRAQDFSRAAQGRQMGQQRYQSFQANRPAGGFQSYRPAGTVQSYRPGGRVQQYRPGGGGQQYRPGGSPARGGSFRSGGGSAGSGGKKEGRR